MAAVSTTTAVVVAVVCCGGARVSYTRYTIAFCLVLFFVCLGSRYWFYSGHVCCVLRVYCMCVSCLAIGFVRPGGYGHELRLFLVLARPEGAMYASVPKNV